MRFSQDLYIQALEFAAKAHGDQKTPLGLPYLAHLSCVAMEVLAIIAEDPGYDGDLALACALLHDTVEDCGTSLADLEAQFGQRVADGVSALTKDPAVEKSARMADSLQRVLRQPPEVAMVKLADRITNLAPPPPQWTKEKIAAYREEARVILETLGSANPPLARRLRDRIAAYPG